MNLKNKLAQVGITKIFIIIAICLMSFGIVYAGVGDLLNNDKTYDKKTKTLKIKNNVEIQLLTPLENHVGLGYQRVAEYEINSKKALKLLVSKMELYDKSDSMREISRTIDYKVKGIKQVKVIDYETICEEVYNKSTDNMTESCTQEISGSHLEERETWLSLDKVDFLRDEKIIVGLFTDVQKGDKIEWIPTFQIDDGVEVRVEEWASWTADLDGYAVVLKVDGETITKGTAFEFDTVYNRYNSLVKINDTHYLNTYSGADGDGFAVVLKVDGETITKGTAFEFDTVSGYYNSLVKINDTHYLNTYSGADLDGYAVVLKVDGETITKGTAFEFDTVQGLYNSLVKINDTHYLNTYTANGDGFAVVLKVDGTTITKGTAFEFDTVNGAHNSLVKINDTHYLNTYSGTDGDGFAVVLKVDGTTITKGTAFEFDTVSGYLNSLFKINDTHYLNTYSGTDLDGYAVVLKVDGETITKGTAFEFDTVNGAHNSLVKINDTHYLNAYSGADADGFAVVLKVDGTTITKGTAFEFDTVYNRYNSLVKINDTHYLNTYTSDGDNGFAVVLKVELPSPPVDNPPTITANLTKPDDVYTNTNWLVNITATDPEETYLDAYTQFYLNDTKFGAEHYFNLTNNTNSQISALLSGNFSEGFNLTAEVWVGDRTENTTKTNMTETVLNSIPTIGSPTLNDSTPYTFESLLCTNGSYSDSDSDSATWFYRWYDGGVLIADQTSNTLELSVANLDKADTIKCSTMASDGTANATAWTNSTEATIQNSIPTTPTDLTINATIYVGEVLSGICSDSTDADTDAITYQYQFYNNGDAGMLQDYSTTQTYTIQTTDAHDEIRVRCKATTTDANSSEDTELITTSDTLPTNPTGSSTNVDARYVADMLTGVGAGSTDTDSDSITYQYQFYNNNASSVIRDYSTTASYQLQTTDAHDLISIRIKATTTYGNSSGIEEVNKSVSNSPQIITNELTTISWNANGSTFSHDYASTDLDEDTAVWWTNSTLFTINSATGEISDTPTESEAGSYAILVNVSDGYLNISDVFLYTINDATNPTTEIIYPTNTSYADTPTFNYTYVETNCANAWFSNDSGLTNYSVQTCGDNFTDMIAVEGLNNWTVFVNDTSGNENSSIIYFTVDTTPPFVNITYPTNTTYTANVTQLNFSVSDTYLDTCWFSTNNSINVTTSCTSNITGLVSIEGLNTWTIYANDTVGNENSSIISFTIDTTAPTISINNPSEGEEEGSDTIILSITTNEISTCDYSIGTNTSMDTSDNLTFTKSIQLIYGSYLVSFYCNDSFNHSNSSSVNFVMVSQGTGATGTGGTTPSVEYLTPIDTIGFTEEVYSTINLESILIENKKLCTNDKLIFKALDKYNDFTLLDSADLYFNNIKKSEKLFLDQTNEEYYYDLESLEAGEVVVKIVANQDGKEVEESVTLNIESCLDIRKVTDDNFTKLLDYIKANSKFFFWGFVFLFILLLTSYVIYTFKK